MGPYCWRIRVLSSGESVSMSMILGDAGGDGDGDGDHVPLEEANLGDSGSIRAILRRCSEMERSQQSASPSVLLLRLSHVLTALLSPFGTADTLLVLRSTPATSARLSQSDLPAADNVAADGNTSLRPTSPRYTRGEHVLQQCGRHRVTLTRL